MKFDFYPPSSWEKLNAEIQEELGLDPKSVRVFAFRGLHHALSEVTQGLVLQFPHKTKAFYFKNQDPFFTLPVQHLSMDGYNIQPLNIELLDKYEPWVEGLGRDSLFCLHSEDNPVTGEAYPVAEFHKSVVAKKVISIQVSHQCFRRSTVPSSLDRHEIRLLSLAPDLAIALVGGRIRFASKVASGFPFLGDFKSEVLKGLEFQSEEKQKVLDFEKNLETLGATPFFKGDQNRIYDRAVVYWKDMDGYALIHYLAQELGHELNPPGEDSFMETTSLSRWAQLRSMDWLLEQGLEPDALRGLVVFSADKTNDGLADSIAKIRNKILDLQK